MSPGKSLERWQEIAANKLTKGWPIGYRLILFRPRLTSAICATGKYGVSKLHQRRDPVQARDCGGPRTRLEGTEKEQIKTEQVRFSFRAECLRALEWRRMDLAERSLLSLPLIAPSNAWTRGLPTKGSRGAGYVRYECQKNIQVRCSLDTRNTSTQTIGSR